MARRVTIEERAVEADQVGVDLGQVGDLLAAEERGRVVHMRDRLFHPMHHVVGGERRPVTITVAGSYSSRYRDAERAAADRRVAERKLEMAQEDLDRERLDVIAACVTAWDGWYLDGEAAPATKENVLRVLQVPYFRTQVEAAIRDHEGFTWTPSDG